MVYLRLQLVGQNCGDGTSGNGTGIWQGGAAAYPPHFGAAEAAQMPAGTRGTRLRHDKGQGEINHSQSAAEENNIKEKRQLRVQHRRNEQHRGGPKLHVPSAHHAGHPDDEQEHEGDRSHAERRKKRMIKETGANTQRQQGKR